MPVTPTLELMQKATAHARNSLSLGAGNKWRSGNSKTTRKSPQDREERQKKASAEVKLLRASSHATLRKYLQDAMTRQAGNCEELAIFAYAYLMSNQVEPVQVVCLERPGDHVFTIAGTIDPKGSLDNIDSWGDAVFVSDPWANVTCKATEYKKAWLDKLTKWDGQGKKLCYNGTFVKPLAEDWTSAIIKNKLVPCYLNGKPLKHP